MSDPPSAESFAKPSVAASVAVFAISTAELLLIRRRRDPYAGQLAFPGGFLDVGQEDVYGTAVRELREEAGLTVDPDTLQLVDVRSDPHRDPREHVIDVGFLCLVSHKSSLAPDTEESPVWMHLSQVRGEEFAFDHASFFAAVEDRLRRDHLAPEESA